MENRISSLKDLFVDQVADLFSAENQLISALPRVANACTNADLREGILEHLEQTRGHAERCKEVFQIIGIPVQAKNCKAMQGLIAETDEMLMQGGSGAVMDAGIIACCQRVEHYEIAGYGCAVEFAKLLDYDDAADLLNKTLDEEADTDKKLNKLATKEINKEALEVATA